MGEGKRALAYWSIVERWKRKKGVQKYVQTNEHKRKARKKPEEKLGDTPLGGYLYQNKTKLGDKRRKGRKNKKGN